VTFVLSCVLLLMGGLSVVLWLNTTMAANAFEKHDLRESIADLTERREVVLERINQHEAPAALAEAAAAEGMVPGTNITYVRLSDGTTIGQPVAAGEDGSEEDGTTWVDPEGEMVADGEAAETVANDAPVDQTGEGTDYGPGGGETP
jgi:hypothetical protein